MVNHGQHLNPRTYDTLLGGQARVLTLTLYSNIVDGSCAFADGNW